MLVHKEDALLAILLITQNQLTFEAPIYNNFQDIQETSIQWLYL